MNVICDVDGLEEAVGSPPLPVLMKSIDHLDDHCIRILAHSRAAVAGYTDTAGALRASALGHSGGAPLVGDRAGFATATDPRRLALELPPDAAPGPVSLLVLVPGWRETLRINGRLTAGDPGAVHVQEAFVHCAKALIRSAFWDAPATAAGGATHGPAARLDDDDRAFLAAARFVVIASEDRAGAADASPKGDPPGFVHVLDDRTVAIPDRPGNRRTDTFHNLVDQPRIAVLALVPGGDRTLEVTGEARLTTDTDLRAAMAVDGRVPKVAVVVTVERVTLADSPALAAADLWNPQRHVAPGSVPPAARIWTDHVKANQTPGLAARAIRAGVNEPAVRAGSSLDYRHNLY